MKHRISMLWPDGLKKAVTFSYDDGVMQDLRLTALFRRYGLKATFNLNSGFSDRSTPPCRGVGRSTIPTCRRRTSPAYTRDLNAPYTPPITRG